MVQIDLYGSVLQFSYADNTRKLHRVESICDHQPLRCKSLNSLLLMWGVVEIPIAGRLGVSRNDDDWCYSELCDAFCNCGNHLQSQRATIDEGFWRKIRITFRRPEDWESDGADEHFLLRYKEANRNHSSYCDARLPIILSDDFHNTISAVLDLPYLLYALQRRLHKRERDL